MVYTRIGLGRRSFWQLRGGLFFQVEGLNVYAIKSHTEDVVESVDECQRVSIEEHIIVGSDEKPRHQSGLILINSLNPRLGWIGISQQPCTHVVVLKLRFTQT